MVDVKGMNYLTYCTVCGNKQRYNDVTCGEPGSKSCKKILLGKEDEHVFEGTLSDAVTFDDAS